MLAWGRQGTRGRHRCNLDFAMLPQPFMRSLWYLQGLPTMVLPFPNPRCFDVFIGGLFLHPSASHHSGRSRADGHLCKPYKWRMDGKGEVRWGAVSWESSFGPD